MKFVFVLTEAHTGKVIGVFPTQRKADKYDTTAPECRGISTVTTMIKKSDWEGE